MQPKRAIFSEDNLSYKYMPLGDGTADVFIYKFIEEKIDDSEEGTEPSFIYDFNEFRVNVDEVTEEMIAASPLDYLNYPEVPETITRGAGGRKEVEKWKKNTQHQNSSKK